MTAINLNGRLVGPGYKPYIVAEMSGNHNQSLEKALNIVDAAADTGVDAIKLQTYTADTITLPCSENEFFISKADSLWEGNSLHALYQKAYTPWEWHRPIFEHAKKRGLEVFSTPFDDTAVDFLEELGVSFYKVASFENAHLPLIKKIAQTGKPVIISTGLASVADLHETVCTLRDQQCNNFILLKCTSAYPASPESFNLATIPHLRDLFQCQVGLSDHSMGIGIAVAAVALGATFIEKHFTISRADGGVDSAFSMEPDEMKALVAESEKVWQSIGQVHYGPTAAEKDSILFRRSLYIAKNLQKGDVLTPENLRAVRPGKGLAPKYYELLLGKKVNQDVKLGTPVSFDLILENADVSTKN